MATLIANIYGFRYPEISEFPDQNPTLTITEGWGPHIWINAITLNTERSKFCCWIRAVGCDQAEAQYVHWSCCCCHCMQSFLDNGLESPKFRLRRRDGVTAVAIKCRESVNEADWTRRRGSRGRLWRRESWQRRSETVKYTTLDPCLPLLSQLPVSLRQPRPTLSEYLSHLYPRLPQIIFLCWFTISDVRFHEILSAWKFQWNIAWKFHENFKKNFNT